MVFKGRRKRLRISISDDESAEEVGQFDGDSSGDSDFEAISGKAPDLDDLFLSDRISLSQQSSLQDGKAWVHKYSSISLQGGLVTSAKKSNEIKDWMKGALDGITPRLLILTGPPGCGKSSAVRAAAKEMECAVSSWQAPVTGFRNISMTLIDDFRAFLVGGRYRALVGEDSESEPMDWSGRKIVLVEDLPVCTTDIAQKRSMIQKIFADAARFSSYPTVVVVSDGDKGVASTVRFVFGADLLASSAVACIKVPGVTHGMMKKRLRGVLQSEGLSFSQNKLEGAVAMARGDIRAALNALQFCSDSGLGTDSSNGLSHSGVENRKRTKRRKRSSARVVQALGSVGQDSSLGTYHAVSKILNNKRDADGRSKYNVEDILMDAKADPSSFLEFLHHNYPDFFTEIDDVVGALECLSEADCFLQWRQDDLSRTGLWDCAASLGTRGFLLHNSKPSRTGWRPIRGPESYQVRRESRAHVASVQREFAGRLAPMVYTQSTLCEVVAYCEQIAQSRMSRYETLPSQVTRRDSASNHIGVGMAKAGNEVTVADSSKQGVWPDVGNGMDVVGEEADDPIAEWDDDDDF